MRLIQSPCISIHSNHHICTYIKCQINKSLLYLFIKLYYTVLLYTLTYNTHPFQIHPKSASRLIRSRSKRDRTLLSNLSLLVPKTNLPDMVLKWNCDICPANPVCTMHMYAQYVYFPILCYILPHYNVQCTYFHT